MSLEGAIHNETADALLADSEEAFLEGTPMPEIGPVRICVDPAMPTATLILVGAHPGRCPDCGRNGCFIHRPQLIRAENVGS